MAFFSYLFKNLNRECRTENSKNFQSPKEAVEDRFLAFYWRRFVVVGPTGWTKSGVQWGNCLSERTWSSRLQWVVSGSWPVRDDRCVDVILRRTLNVFSGDSPSFKICTKTLGKNVSNSEVRERIDKIGELNFSAAKWRVNWFLWTAWRNDSIRPPFFPPLSSLFKCSTRKSSPLFHGRSCLPSESTSLLRFEISWKRAVSERRSRSDDHENDISNVPDRLRPIKDWRTHQIIFHVPSTKILRY